MPGEHWWVVELREAKHLQPAAPRRRRRLRARARRAVRRRHAAWLARFDGDERPPRAPVPPRRPIRYSYVPRAVAARRLPDGLRAAARQRGDAERRPAVHARAGHAARRAGRPRRAARAAHRRVLAERDEPPYPERYACPSPPRGWSTPPATRRPGDRRRHDGRARARDGRGAATASSAPADGWTDLVVTPERGLCVVDGLITGWHEPEASHLQLLEAAAGATAAARALRRGAGERLSLARVRRQPPRAALSANSCRTPTPSQASAICVEGRRLTTPPGRAASDPRSPSAASLRRVGARARPGRRPAGLPPGAITVPSSNG